MGLITLLGIIIAICGVYFLAVARNILVGLICLIVGIVILTGGVVLPHH